MALPDPTTEDRGAVPAIARGIVVVGLLYLFLIGVSLLEGGIKGLGSDIQDELFSSVTNPIAGLCVGVLATVLAQSSASSAPGSSVSTPPCR